MSWWSVYCRSAIPWLFIFSNKNAFSKKNFSKENFSKEIFFKENFWKRNLTDFCFTAKPGDKITGECHFRNDGTDQWHQVQVHFPGITTSHRFQDAGASTLSREDGFACKCLAVLVWDTVPETLKSLKTGQKWTKMTTRESSMTHNHFCCYSWTTIENAILSVKIQRIIDQIWNHCGKSERNCIPHRESLWGEETESECGVRDRYWTSGPEDPQSGVHRLLAYKSSENRVHRQRERPARGNTFQRKFPINLGSCWRSGLRGSLPGYPRIPQTSHHCCSICCILIAKYPESFLLSKMSPWYFLKLFSPLYWRNFLSGFFRRIKNQEHPDSTMRQWREENVPCPLEPSTHPPRS